MVKESDRHEAEDERVVGPEPIVLVQDEQHEEYD